MTQSLECIIRAAETSVTVRELLAVTLVGNGELLTTLRTTGSQHAAAISGGHTFTETVLVLSSAIVGLKCTFHNAIFLLFCCLRWSNGLQK